MHFAFGEPHNEDSDCIIILNKSYCPIQPQTSPLKICDFCMFTLFKLSFDHMIKHEKYYSIIFHYIKISPT